MRLAYLVHWSDGPSSGVFKKVVSQARWWHTQGVQVGLFVLSRSDTGCQWEEHAPGLIAAFARYGHNPFSRMRAARQLARAIFVWQPEVLYTRYDLFYPPWAPVFRAISTVLEINTDDVTEFAFGNRARRFYNRVTRPLTLALAQGLIFVSHELAERPHFRRYGKRSAVISNGIALADYPLAGSAGSANRPACSTAGAPPTVVFLGTSAAAPWQGVEKILWLAGQQPSWRFWLIGVAAHLADQPVPDNVTVFGAMDRDAYGSLLQQADVAIGTLALHRKGMDEASTLKVREYLAWGLPVIVGYRETDFPQEHDGADAATADFVLQLPNTPDNVMTHAQAIERFVLRWRGRRVPRERVAHLDVAVKEAQRLAFFREVGRVAGKDPKPRAPTARTG